MEWAGLVARMREMIHAYKIFVGRLQGKRPLGRHRRRWKDNMRMDLRETGWEGVEWIRLAQDRDQWWDFVNTVMSLRSP
jgi:hypothetical protein